MSLIWVSVSLPVTRVDKADTRQMPRTYLCLLSIVFCEGDKGRETLGSDESGRVLRQVSF